MHLASSLASAQTAPRRLTCACWVADSQACLQDVANCLLSAADTCSSSLPTPRPSRLGAAVAQVRMLHSLCPELRTSKPHQCELLVESALQRPNRYA